MSDLIPSDLKQPFSEFESNGELTVKHRFSSGNYSNDSSKYAAAKLWLEHKNNERLDTFSLNVLNLSQRQAKATEAQARWAKIATIISIIALVFSAFPYIRTEQSLTPKLVCSTECRSDLAPEKRTP